jgi:hypothetical protein
MGKTTFTALVAAALVVLTVLTLAVPAEAGRGRGYGRHHHYHGGDGWNAVGAGLLGFGVGAIVGSALTPREVYVAPPPPRPTYYTPAGYGPPPWTPDWYTYCYSRYRSFDPNSGTFVGYDGYEHFCR